MHPGATLYVGFGGYDRDVRLPEGFDDIFKDDENPKVLTPDGDPINYESDDADLPERMREGDRKYFRRIHKEWNCYSFVLGQLDTHATIDLAALARESERWMPALQHIAQRYGITMTPKVHVLSFMD